MVAIYSLKTYPNIEDQFFCGYNTQRELFDSLLLSSKISYRNFDKVEFWTDSFGYECLKEDGRDFSHLEIHLELDQINWLDYRNWTFPKIWVYSRQKHPFVHIDIDAFIYHKLRPMHLDKKFLFDKLETFDRFTWYKDPFEMVNKLGIIPKDFIYPKNAVNSGVFGVFDIDKFLEFRDIWFEMSLKYIKDLQISGHIDVLPPYHAIIPEQLFLSYFLEKFGVTKDDCSYLLNPDDSLFSNFYYEHYIGDKKRQSATVKKIYDLAKYYR